MSAFYFFLGDVGIGEVVADLHEPAVPVTTSDWVSQKAETLPSARTSFFVLQIS